MLRIGRFGASAALVALLTGCGGDGGSSGTIAATPSPEPVASTPAPAPAPAPVASTPAPAPAPSAAPVAAVEPYVLGTLTFTLAPDIPADKIDGIRDAMTFAVAHTNTLGAFSGNVWVVYGSGTPTADAGFQGQIRFGGSIGRRVALHELAHWYGSGSVWQWGTQMVNGRFAGPITTARMKAFDGPDAYQSGDRAHFWPYGLNYDSEFRDTQRNTQLVSSQRADMGLGPDVTPAIAGTRRFHNRSAGLVLQGAAAGATAVEAANASGPAQQWRVEFADGFITLVNIDTGLAIEATGTGDNVATVMAAASGTARQQWEMMPTGDGGWFLLRNRATGNCLDNIGNLVNGGAVRLWGCGWHPNQQWQLVR